MKRNHITNLRNAVTTNFSAITHLLDRYADSKHGIVVEKADKDAVDILQAAILKLSDEIYKMNKETK